jgi:hypothetical protein
VIGADAISVLRVALDCFASLAMTPENRHREEPQGDEAIQGHTKKL